MPSRGYAGPVASATAIVRRLTKGRSPRERIDSRPRADSAAAATRASAHDGRHDATVDTPGSRACRPMTNRELIEQYNRAWNLRDLSLIASMHDPEMVFENHTAGERAEGEHDVIRHIAGILNAWPDLSFATRRLYEGADHVVCEWTATATHVQPLRRGDLVAAPTGRSITWPGVDIFSIRRERIARKDVYSDSVTILRAVALLT